MANPPPADPAAAGSPPGPRPTTLFNAIATVSGLTLLSRVAGFARDVLTAGILGAGPVADAFFVALRLPNFFRRVFAEGAFSVSFVPIYAEKLEKEGRAAAVEFAEFAQALLGAFLILMTGLAIALMPYVIAGFAPGFLRDAERYGLAVEFSQLTFTYLPMISLVALIGGLLNAEGRFAPFAASPLFFNACLITALLAATPFTGTAGHALSYGVLAAGIVQLIWMVACLGRAGIFLRLRLPRLTPDMRQLLRLMGPGALTAGVMQINLFVDVLLASLLPIGAVSYLYYADRLYQLPLGLIGTAIGTALLPLLAREIAAANDKGIPEDQALESQGIALELGLLVALPAAFVLFVLPQPIIAVLFERGAFLPTETAATALALAAYALGIPAHVIARVFSVAHFARKDTVTPSKIAVVTTLCNIGLSLALISPLAHVGLALATTITFWLNAILLGISLRRRGSLRLGKGQFMRLSGQIAAALLCAAAAYFAHAGMQGWQPGTDTLTRALNLLAALTAGLLVFLAVARLSGAMTRTSLRQLAGRGTA